MSRILFWVALIVLIVFAVRSKLRSMSVPPPDARPDPQIGDGEAMACCAHCHIYFPASESVRADGLDYCSPGHVRLPAK